MTSLDAMTVMHPATMESDRGPVKQVARRINPCLATNVKAEVDKLVNASFINEVQYPGYLENLVPVKKKNG